MKKVRRISTEDQKTSIEIHESNNGTYVFQKYAKKYDTEEDVYYEVRITPDPSGIYGDIESATKEAKLLLSLE